MSSRRLPNDPDSNEHTVFPRGKTRKDIPVKSKHKAADIFVDIRAHAESGRFIRDHSVNRQDIRDFAFHDVDLRDCRDILDLGCAYGFFTRGLAGRLHPRAVLQGVDLCRECGQYYIASCRESGYAATYCLSDQVFCERYPDDSFDLVLCTYALYFFPQAIPEIARILRPDGVFITVTHAVPHMRELIDIFKVLLAGRLRHPVQILPLEELFAAFSSANGRKLLSPWFRQISEKEYGNSLLIDKASLPELIRYLCFKSVLFLPEECGLDERFIKSAVADYLHDLLNRRPYLTIAKNDTIYICRQPVKRQSAAT